MTRVMYVINCYSVHLGLRYWQECVCVWSGWVVHSCSMHRHQINNVLRSSFIVVVCSSCCRGLCWTLVQVAPLIPAYQWLALSLGWVVVVGVAVLVAWCCCVLSLSLSLSLPLPLCTFHVASTSQTIRRSVGRKLVAARRSYSDGQFQLISSSYFYSYSTFSS